MDAHASHRQGPSALLARLGTWSLAALLLAGAGCATPRPLGYSTPTSPQLAPAELYPTSAAYQLLNVVTGEACGLLSELASATIPDARPGEPGTGHPVLYQSAKFNALQRATDADNLASIRVSVTQVGERQCVTVAGRAYRLTALRSEAPTITHLTSDGLLGRAAGAPALGSGLLGAAQGLAAGASAGSRSGGGLEVRLGPSLGLNTWEDQFQLAISYVSGGFELPIELGVGGDPGGGDYYWDESDSQYDKTGHGENATLAIMPAARLTLAGASGFAVYAVLGGGVIFVPEDPLLYLGLRAGVVVDLRLSDGWSLLARMTTDFAPVSVGKHHGDPFDRVPVILALAFGASYAF